MLVLNVVTVLPNLSQTVMVPREKSAPAVTVAGGKNRRLDGDEAWIAMGDDVPRILKPSLKTIMQGLSSAFTGVNVPNEALPPANNNATLPTEPFCGIDELP